MTKLLQEIYEILSDQKELKVSELENEYILSGLYSYTLEFNEYCVEGKKNIKFVIPKNFPYDIPTFYVYEYPKEIEHIYPDNSVCLATIGEIIKYINENSSIVKFWNKFVNSFIFTLEWFEKYNNYPFGDRKHGYIGLIEYYLEDLNISMVQYMKMVSLINEEKYRGHSMCFCDSGKKIRNCHGSFILPILRNKHLKELFIKEAYLILSKDGTE